MHLRTITWLALVALLTGLTGGAAMAAAQSSWLEPLTRVLDPVGTMWINAVRMTIIPLVISLIVVAVASSDSLKSMGRLGGTALLFFLLALAGIALVTALLAPVLLGGLEIDPAAAASLRETASSSSQRVTETVRGMGGIGQRLVELIPPNPFGAAAEGAMLPLIAFTIVFAAALSRVPADLRETPVRFFRALSEAMIVVVRWVFMIAPVGVFALALTVGGRLGYGAVTAVGLYVAVFSGVMLIVTLGMYVMTFLSGVPVRRFAAAAAPAQIIALGSRSSSAAFPAMVDAARDVLRVPPQVLSFVLPLAVAIFRASTPVSFILGALFLGRLYGVVVTPGDVAWLGILSVVLSYSVPPVPSGSLFLMAPVFAEMGIPVEGVAILIAVDVIPDLFKTLGNVTSNMASAAVVAAVTERGAGRRV